ncbi:NhaC family Na+:H+ antiporter [Natranaerovirga hydrolytica]|uniref:NhaC family Na+:H+ antiporter n=1 Tax=Natranaerovirga hydrolytica TaxID=680378 RepID=A0A4R1MJ72_9FIRM|nr:Na+/H+ antiporter NhaC [Natranaerovirga hydrolytica]TCK92746.1 NhaC family Na+:H+ antiporter [Natranaerovirga hydrolytica]
MSKSNEKEIPMPSIRLAIIPILVVIIALTFSVFIFDAEPHIALFFGAATAGIVAFVHGYSWETIQSGFTESVHRAIPSLLILLIIGMIIGVWIASGIVPALMYYGFELLLPQWFLPSILILCSIMSVITGSSWTTVGTIGVAAIGVGQGLGIPAPAIAGTIVSGAFFGDKLSPMSDSTNLTPSVLGVDLYVHIKHMLFSTVPSFLIALAMYTVLGFFLAEGSADPSIVAEYQDVIMENFNLSFLLIIPPIIVIALILFKVPAIPSLIAGVVLGGIMQITVQGQSVSEFFNILYEGFSISTGWEEMDMLLTRGGMSSMYDVVSLALVALAFGGIMNRCKMLDAIVSRLSRFLKSVGNLVTTTIGTSIFLNIFSANQYLAVIIPGQMYEDCYKAKGLKFNNLTRALEAGGTLTAPLIPWNSSGAFVLSVLSVNPLAYAPYAFICWLTFIIVIFFGYKDITMDKTYEFEIE